LRDWLTQAQIKQKLSDAEVSAASGTEVQEKGVLNWRWVQAILEALDGVPGISALSIALATKDVHDYLTKTTIRNHIDAGVRSAFASGKEAIVVSHSLGTVVAYNVLSHWADTQPPSVPLLITLGSPLAVAGVKRILSPIRHPACVGRWFNAIDQRDVVALFPLDTNHFNVDPSIENKMDVNNSTTNRHGIRGYLEDAEVARRIHAAVVG
jgi:pimeloyl-ACP methyl ester carboxylesterase